MFVNLHVHDAKGSILDSILRVEDIVSFAKNNNQNAIAITNHGYMTSYVDFVKECNKQNIKPIIGNEVYEVNDMFEKADTKDYTQKRYHLVLLCKTKQGFNNLIKITSVSCTDGLYKKPRIDLKYIKENNLGEGIICLTACQAGRLSRLLEDKNQDDAIKFVSMLKETFDSVYCELQSHNTESQTLCNKLIYDFSQKNNLPYVITTDAHMLNNDLLKSHEMFVLIGEDRDVGEIYTDCCLQTEEYVHSVLDNHLSKEIVDKGIYETQKISEEIEFIDIGLNNGNIMPEIKIDSKFKTHLEYLRYLVFDTFKDKFGHMKAEDQDIRRKRIEEELDVLEYVDYIDYFIMLYMLAKKAKERGIPIGYSRGSGANCECLFMLNVTQIDSVRWDLDFSRFANKGRKSLADFDWDISKRRRKEMVEISEELFGKDNVAPICTFNTLSTKVAIRDIGKVLNEKDDSPYYQQIPYTLRDEVAKMIPTIKTLNDLGEEEEKELLLKDILSKNKKLKDIYDKFPLWFKYVMDVEGLPKSLGRHAAGTLITPKAITEYCPLCFDGEKNTMIQLEMHNAMDDLGLVKMDYLGLETLDIIDDTLNLAGLTWDDVDINHLDLEDKKVFDTVYKKGNNVGVFQMESAEAKRMCIEAEVDNVEDVVVVNAANRPGTKESFPQYCDNKLYPSKIQVVHDDLKEIFKKTHCILLYQEQALQLFRYAGFPESDVDNARRCIDENSLILMGNGDYKKIKDVHEGDLVSCLNENINTMEYKKVKKVFDNGFQETFKIKTQCCNEIVATKGHKVLTQDGWKKVEDLTINDYIMSPKTIHSYRDDILSKYKPCDDVMFLTGLLIGDGSLINKKSIHFTNSEDIVIDKFKKCVNSLSRNHKECKFRQLKQVGKDVDYIYSMYIITEEYKKSLNELCDRFDLIHKAEDKYVCEEIMNYPLGSKLTSFIAGLFNTDGGYNTKAGRIEYYTISKKLAYQIKSLLMKYKIYSYINIKKVKGYNYNTYTIMIQQLDSIKTFIEKINPFVVGRKKQDYINVFNIANNRNLQYNYILPKKYYTEIREMVNDRGMTFSDFERLIGDYSDNSFKISTNNLTDSKAWKIIKYVTCKNTYEMLTAEYIPLKIKSIENNGVNHVYDMEVENNHNYVANNLIVHNCIGKKDKERMKSLEIDFRNGLSKLDWKQNQIDEIWGLILKQAEYSFNRGHAVAYGLLSYLTAYLKTHYTIYFMTALLTSKSDKVEKISVVINDCKRLNIKVSPPNVNRSNSTFTSFQENNEILFGLLAVKGLGESVVNKIIEQRPYKNFTDFVKKVKDKTAIITLIKAGAIPTKDKMNLLKRYAEMLSPKKEYTPVISLPSPYMKLLSYGLDVEDYKIGKKVDKERLLNDYNKIKERDYINTQQERYKNSMIEFRNKYAMDEYMWEFDTLSMFLTNDPLKDAYLVSDLEWDSIEDGEKTIVFCVIVDIKRKKDKHGNQYAYLDLYTPYGIIEGTIWSSQLKEYNELIKKGKCLAIKGRKRDEHFFVENVKTYNKWKSEGFLNGI